MTPDVPAPGGADGLGAAAQRAVDAAEAEARHLGHQTVGTEHLLLGLLASEGSGAATALQDAGVTLAAARHKVAEAVGGGGGAPADTGEPLPRTSRAARALNRAVRFSHQARAGAVATSHLLLGVLDVEGRAGQVLRGLGVDLNALRSSLADVEDVEQASDPPQRTATAARTSAGPRVASRMAPAATCPSCRTELVHDVAYRVVKARSEGLRARDALLYSCGTCGVVLGVGPA